MDTNRYLARTRLLDFEDPSVERVITGNGWRTLEPYDRIGAIYRYVRDRIAFGYNADDCMRASDILRDGYGQCNTKGIVFMALLRGSGIPCRFHGFTIHNELQRGAIPDRIMALAPAEIVHSWVEVRYDDRWIELEGFILDSEYLTAVQRRFSEIKGRFTGFGIATTCLADPPVSWTGGPTFIQREGIFRDLGIHDSPDLFFGAYGSNLSGLRRFLYRRVIRHLINRNVQRIRGSHR